MEYTDKQKLHDLRLELEQIDNLNWHGSGMIPESARWYNVVGDEDANGNWKIPAELLGNNETEVQRIKAQRRIVAKMRVLYAKDDNEEVHRSKEEQQDMLENVSWCKKFGLSNKETSFVLGEKLNYINKVSSKLKRGQGDLQTAS